MEGVEKFETAVIVANILTATLKKERVSALVSGGDCNCKRQIC